jgi:aspartate racemase
VEVRRLRAAGTREEGTVKVIGILGGMGPEASADLYLKLIQRSYRRAGEDMGGYPHIWINNIPVPNIFQQGQRPIGPYLGEQARLLEQAGAQVIGIACNSAHFYFDDIQHGLSGSATLVHMIDEAAERARNDGARTVGVLSSAVARPLYMRALEEQGLQAAPLTALEQEQVERMISSVLSGVRTRALKQELKHLANAQVAAGADCVILGCTDLPIILSQVDVDYPLYSSTEVLADALFDLATSDS